MIHKMIMPIIIAFIFSSKPICINANQKKFTPDTSINKVLSLHNPYSFRAFISQTDTLVLYSNIREAPVFIFFNYDKTEYLILYQYEGAKKYSFDCFEFGYNNQNAYEGIKTDYPFFETESGIKPGITYDELIKIKGKPDKIIGDTVQYVINDLSNSIFLRKYNMPEYFMICIFSGKKLTKIKFGFTYP